MPNRVAADCPQVTEWLTSFARFVRERDYASARRLFVDEASGFGTVAGMYSGLDDLVNGQWSNVWERTADFDFDLDSAEWTGDESGGTVWSLWSSMGVETKSAQRPRTGRATIVLVNNEGALRAVHSHFSMDPGQTA